LLIVDTKATRTQDPEDTMLVHRRLAESQMAAPDKEEEAGAMPEQCARAALECLASRCRA
jgi:hypothetical protein